MPMGSLISRTSVSWPTIGQDDMRFILLSLIAIAIPLVTSAGTVRLVETDEGIYAYIDAEHRSINVIEGELVFADAPPSRIETGGSIVTLWIDTPRRDGTRLAFSGMIPGGFHGMAEPARGLEGEGLLFFLPDASGEVAGSIRVHLHDGEGTKVDAVIATSSRTTKARAADTEPPEAASVTVLPATGDTPRLLVAIGTDTGGGVARYEVSLDGTWREFEPPLEIPDEEARIVVRIFDHEGNFREIVAQEGEPKNDLPIVVIAALACIVVIALLFRRRRLV